MALWIKGVHLENGKPGIDSRVWPGSFSGSSHTSNIKSGNPVATLPGAWRYRVSIGTGWPSVRILLLGEIYFFLSATSISVWQQYVCHRRSIPLIHWHVAWALNNQQTTNSNNTQSRLPPAVLGAYRLAARGLTLSPAANHVPPTLTGFGRNRFCVVCSISKKTIFLSSLLYFVVVCFFICLFSAICSVSIAEHTKLL